MPHEPIPASIAAATTAALPQLVPGRACGSCMMCCKVPAIAEFQKPPGVWCSHAIAGKGCDIYADRPGSCRAFYCLWMQDAHFGPEWKPEKAKFVVYLQQNGANLQVAVDPKFPNAWRRDPFYPQIVRWAREGAERGAFVFVRIGARMLALMPDREIDLGRVDADDEIAVARRPAAGGFTYDVTVKRRDPVG